MPALRRYGLSYNTPDITTSMLWRPSSGCFQSRRSDLTGPWSASKPNSRRLLRGATSSSSTISPSTRAHAPRNASETGRLVPRPTARISTPSKAFAKLKAYLRATAARTFDALWKAIGNICDLFSRTECWNYPKGTRICVRLNVRCSSTWGKRPRHVQHPLKTGARVSDMIGVRQAMSYWKDNGLPFTWQRPQASIGAFVASNGVAGAGSSVSRPLRGSFEP